MTIDPWAKRSYRDAPPPAIRGFGPSPYAEWADGYNVALAAIRPLYEAAIEGWRVSNEHLAAERARAERAEATLTRIGQIVKAWEGHPSTGYIEIAEVLDALVAERDA